MTCLIGLTDSDSVNLGSNPSSPASHCGLYGVASPEVRTHAISAGYALPASLRAVKGYDWGPANGDFRLKSLLRFFQFPFSAPRDRFDFPFSARDRFEKVAPSARE
jgi:hypothetical protein